MKEIRSFQDVERSVCKDLAWYMCYESLYKTQQQLHMGMEEITHSSLQQGLFSYMLEKNFEELLKKHVFFDQDIQIHQSVINQAASYFNDRTQEANIRELGSYLNYLENWAQTYTDWTCNRPVPFQNMMFVHSD